MGRVCQACVRRMSGVCHNVLRNAGRYTYKGRLTHEVPTCPRSGLSEGSRVATPLRLIVDSEVRGTTLQKLIVDSEVRGTTLQTLIMDESEVK